MNISKGRKIIHDGNFYEVNTPRRAGLSILWSKRKATCKSPSSGKYQGLLGQPVHGNACFLLANRASLPKCVLQIVISMVIILSKKT